MHLYLLPLVVWKSSSDTTPLHPRNMVLGDERSRRGKCRRRTQRGVKIRTILKTLWVFDLLVCFQK